MIQLTYEPAFDAFHAMFRMLRIREFLRNAVPLDLIRILDFYVAFPNRLKDIRFQQGDGKLRRIANRYASRKPYAIQPSPHAVFSRMEFIQVAAVQTLAEAGVVGYDPRRQIILFNDSRLPQELERRIRHVNDEQSDLLELIGVLIEKYGLYGPDGLKARTGLLDYRYDVV